MSKEEQKTEEVLKKKEAGFFSKLFLVNPEEDVKVISKPNTNTEQPVVAVVAPQPVMYSNLTNTVGVINQDIYNNLKQILNECNLPGPDYLELKTASDANKALIQDENMRFQFSYNSLKATSPSLNKKNVLESIDKYIEFIEKERDVAKKESDDTYNSEVTLRQDKINEITAEIEEAKNNIISLNEKIVTLSNEINTLGGEKLAKETELSIKKKNFDITIDTIVNELKSDKVKIETLINE